MKDNRLFLKHIFDAIKTVQEYLKGRTFDDFTKNEMLFDAVTRQIEIIGEASTRLSEEFREKNDSLPIKQAVAMRNQLIHGYSKIDPKIVWKTTQEDLPELKEKIKNLI